jgi:integrase
VRTTTALLAPTASDPPNSSKLREVPKSRKNQDTIDERTGWTLNRLVERFRSESGHLAAATRQKLDCHFTVAARHLDFDRDVATVKLADLRQLKSKLSEGRKPSTVNDILFKALGALFRIAVEDEVIGKSPLDLLPPSRKSEPDRQQPTWEQSQRIVEEVTDSSPETGVIVAFMRHFGVGQAEIKGLTGEDIDFQTGVIHFRRKKTGKPFDVPIFPHAEGFIKALKAGGYVSVGRAVVPWRTPRKALATACHHLGLPGYEPRALRRCFIVHCLQQGIDPRLVAKWQGHKDAKLIFSVYGKFIDRAYEQEQAQKLVAFPGGRSSEQVLLTEADQSSISPSRSSESGSSSS